MNETDLEYYTTLLRDAERSIRQEKAYLKVIESDAESYRIREEAVRNQISEQKVYIENIEEDLERLTTIVNQ